MNQKPCSWKGKNRIFDPDCSATICFDTPIDNLFPDQLKRFSTTWVKCGPCGNFNYGALFINPNQQPKEARNILTLDFSKDFNPLLTQRLIQSFPSLSFSTCSRSTLVAQWQQVRQVLKDRNVAYLQRSSRRWRNTLNGLAAMGGVCRATRASRAHTAADGTRRSRDLYSRNGQKAMPIRSGLSSHIANFCWTTLFVHK